MTDRPTSHRLELSRELLALPLQDPRELRVVVASALALLSEEFDSLSAQIAPAAERVPALPAPGRKRRPARRRKRKSGHNAEASPATSTRPAAKPAAAPAPACAAAITLNGVTIDPSADNQRVSFNGKETEITARQAELLIMLARGMPNPIGSEFLCRKLFPARNADSAAQGVSLLKAETAAAVEAIGLEVFTVRGVGLVLRPLP